VASLERKLILAETDVSEEDRDKLARACAENDFSPLREEVTEKFAEGVTDERVSSFLNLLEGGSIDHSNVVELGNVLREYGVSHESPEELTEKEVEVINFGIKYLNSWLKRGGLTGFKDFNNKNEKLALDFATLSFIINQLAKIKSLDKEGRITSLDKEFVLDLLGESEEFVDDYFDATKFASDIELKDVRVGSLKDDYQLIKDQRSLIEEKQRKIVSQIMAQLTGQINVDIKEGNDVILEFKSVASNPRIIEIMIENDIDLGGAWKKLSEESGASDKEHDLKETLARVSELPEDEVKRILVISQIKIKPTQELDNYRINSASLKELKSKIVLFEHEDISLRHQLEIERRNLVNLDSIKNDMRESFRSVRQNIANDKAGVFYTLKEIIAGLELARRETGPSGSRMMDLRMKSLLSDKRGRRVMSFLENDQTKDPTWYKVHVYRKHMVALRFVAEHLLKTNVDKQVSHDN
jgi:hypothetical protein